MKTVGVWLGALSALLVQPSLWMTAIRQYFALVPPRWYSRSPFVPVPSPAYVRFRISTHTGGASQPDPVEFVRYLEWCRQYRRLSEATSG